MNAQTSTGDVSVIFPIGQALDRVGRMCFRPFDPNKWFIIGFCAWLAYLGQGGGIHTGFRTGGWPPGQNLRAELHQAHHFITANLYWIVPVAIGVTIFSLAIWVLILWLSSRGRFMFLHCVALDKAEVALPWNRYAAQANSLFWFRLVVGIVTLVPTIPLVAIIAIGVLRMVEAGEPNVPGIFALVAVAAVLAAIGFIFAVLWQWLENFVVPLMYLRRATCLTAWRESLRLLAAQPVNFLLFLLMQFVVHLAIGMLVVVVILITCCLAGCLLAIPYLGTVFLLPVLVFQRSYPLFYLAQYGPEYNVFAAPNNPTVQ